MNKAYETPRLVASKLELGVFGEYGQQDGGGNQGSGRSDEIDWATGQGWTK